MPGDNKCPEERENFIKLIIESAKTLEEWNEIIQKEKNLTTK